MVLPDDADLLYIAEEGVSFKIILIVMIVKSTSTCSLASIQQLE